MPRILAALALAVLLAPAAAAQPAGLDAPGQDDAAARALVAALPRATRVNDADGDRLFDDLEAAYAASPASALPVVVSFTGATPPARGVERARAELPGLAPTRTFTIVPGFAADLTLAEALRLARLPEVRQLELNRAAQPELDTATAFMGADAAVDQLNATGEGIVIAVIDTGIDGDHADFADGKILRFVDIAEDEEGDANDYDGHGTHVASIAAGLGRGDAEYRGVAPGARLVGLQIRDLDDAIAAYEYVVEHREELGIRIATMSFGFGIATDGTTALERAVDAAWDAGIVCFKSNGNSGPNRGTMTVPAAARGILGIGSLLDPGGAPPGLPLVGNPGLPLPGGFGFALSGFSSRGPTADGRIKPDLVAPGQAVTAAANGTGDEYVTFSGTSMASPFAAGTAALVLSANPALAPDDVKRILLATAEDWGLAGPDVDYGHGRIRAREAVLLALREAGVTPPASDEPVVPFHEVRAGRIAAPFFTGTFEVNDTEHPIAGTFIAEGALLRVDILGPDDRVVGTLTAPAAPARQHVASFEPSQTGTYTFRVVGAPDTPFVVDFSHGTADTLGAFVDELPLVGREGVAPAATADGAAVPGAGLWALLATAALGASLPRRRR